MSTMASNKPSLKPKGLISASNTTPASPKQSPISSPKPSSTPKSSLNASPSKPASKPVPKNSPSVPTCSSPKTASKSAANPQRPSNTTKPPSSQSPKLSTSSSSPKLASSSSAKTASPKLSTSSSASKVSSSASKTTSTRIAAPSKAPASANDSLLSNLPPEIKMTFSPRAASTPLPRTINALLPDEIILLVFRKITTPFQLLVASTVCTRWKSISDERALWQAMYQKKYQESPPTSNWKSLYIKKTLQEAVVKINGKLKRAHTTNTIEAAKMLRLVYAVKISGRSIPVSIRDISQFPFTTCVKCSSIPHVLLKDLKQIEVSVSSVLLNNGNPKLIASFQIRKDNLKAVYADEKGPISLFMAQQDGYSALIGVFPGDHEVGFLHITCFHLYFMSSLLPPSAMVHKPLPSHHKPMFDDLDRNYGLNNYTVSIVLRTTGKVKWSSYFTKVDYKSIEDKKQILFVILDGTDKPHLAHSFEGNLALPWKTDTFSNTVPNMAMIDWMLLDDAGNSMWVESGAISLVPAGNLQDSALTPMTTIYNLPDGDINEFKYENSGKGHIDMRMVYSEKDKRTTVWELVFVLNASFLNNWFCTSY